MNSQSRSPHRSQHERGTPNANNQVFFKPDLPEVDLLDSLAEKQADAMPGEAGRGGINSNQLRKYFGEIKDLYLQYQAKSAQQNPGEVYMKSIEPRFKMIRSKVSYGSRQGSQGKLSKEFARMISEGIARVRPKNHHDFELFVMHLEAVVGFMYGKGKISK